MVCKRNMTEVNAVGNKRMEYDNMNYKGYFLESYYRTDNIKIDVEETTVVFLRIKMWSIDMSSV